MFTTPKRPTTTTSTHGRSTEAPMDFEFTSRPGSDVKPVWARDSMSSMGDENSPRKRNHDDLTSSVPQTPKFGMNHNIPFIFHSENPPPSSPSQYPWSPETKDVDMVDASPPSNRDNASTKTDRPVATGALRRVYKARHKTPGKSKLSRRMMVEDDESEGSEEGESDDDEGQQLIPNTSHHYTLNMASPEQPKAEGHAVLLGYLQFFFNLSLILIFLYLLVLFILTVQRDVEHRVLEYSMDMVQEITSCAARYRENNCHAPIPAVEKQCSVWNVCMNKDPTKLGRARISAETMAEIVNSFVDAISWKTLIFTLCSLSFLTVFVNALLSLYRSRYQQQAAQGAPIAHPSSNSLPLPPTQPFGGYLQPGQHWGRNEDVTATPRSRRRRLEGGASVKI